MELLAREVMPRVNDRLGKTGMVSLK